MATNKPLPRKQRVLNRGYLYSRSKDDVKNSICNFNGYGWCYNSLF